MGCGSDLPSRLRVWSDMSIFRVFGLGWLISGAVALAVSPPVIAAEAPSSPSADPAALVRRASQNELRSTAPPYPVRYKLRKQDEKGITTKEIVETKDGDVARLIAKGRQAADAGGKQGGTRPLNNLLAHPEIQEHRHKREQEDSGRADEMTKLLPDAFLYTYAGLTGRARTGRCTS
jgi:hypothetical protein